jgi:hypothetical protein
MDLMIDALMDVMTGLSDDEVEICQTLEDILGKMCNPDDFGPMQEYDRDNWGHMLMWMTQLTHILAERSYKKGQVDVLDQTIKNFYAQGPPLNIFQQSHQSDNRQARIHNAVMTEARDAGRM